MVADIKTVKPRVGNQRLTSRSDRKPVKTIDVPSPAAPNLNFGPDEAVIYIMAVDDQNNAPYWGKVYEVPNK